MTRIAPATPTNSSGPRVYLVAIVLFALVIGSLEAALPNVRVCSDGPDSARLWAYHRSQVVGNDPGLVVAIGTSRIRTDLRPDVFHERLPSHRFVQLGINGTASPFDLLAQISRIPNSAASFFATYFRP